MMDRLLTAGLCGNTIGQDIQTRGDSRVSGYPGLSPKIQDLLLLHIDDWPVYMKFIIKCTLYVSQKYELPWAVPDGSKLRFIILMRMKTQ